VLDGGAWLTLRVGRFTPGKEPHYPLKRGLGGPQNWPGSSGEENFFYGDSNPAPSSPCCNHYADRTTPASWSLLTRKISTDCLANFAQYKFVLWMKCHFFGRNNSSEFA